MKCFLVALFFILHFGTFASTELSKQEIHALFQTIESNYGPLEMKKQSVGMNWEKTKKTVSEKLLKAKTQRQYKDCASLLFGFLRDSHVSIRLPSDYVAKLPLQFAYVQGKTIINFIDTYAWSKVGMQSPFQLGDEIVKIDGKSPDEIRKLMIPYRGNGNILTDQSILTLNLTHRAEARGLPHYLVPKPGHTSTIVYKRQGELLTTELNWQTSGMRDLERPLVVVDDAQYVSKLPQNTPGVGVDPAIEDKIQKTLHELKQNALAKPYVPSKRMKELKKVLQDMDALFSNRVSEESGLLDFFRPKAPSKKTQGTLISLGQKKPFYALPDNFKPISAPKEFKGILDAANFYAGTFERNGKTIGYLRIPSYSPDNLMATPYSIRYYMGLLEQQTDMLIIDQWNNPGGYVAFSDWIISALTGGLKPEEHLKFAIRPREGFIKSYATLIQSLIKLLQQTPEQDASYATIEEYIKLLELEFAKMYRAYLRGDFLSDPISLALKSKISLELLDHSVDQRLASTLKKASTKTKIDLTQEQYYTKPVYFLINEYDFSGGDATPATLKDLGRVTLVGRNTAGAGGTVESFKSEIFTPFSYSLTTSLMVRRSGDLVENYGVAPDIEFNFTQEDYLNSFKTLFERLLKTLNI